MLLEPSLYFFSYVFYEHPTICLGAITLFSLQVVYFPFSFFALAFSGGHLPISDRCAFGEATQFVNRVALEKSCVLWVLLPGETALLFWQRVWPKSCPKGKSTFSSPFVEFWLDMTTRVCRLRTVRPKAPQVNQVVRPLQSVSACPQACSINIVSEVKTSSQTQLVQDRMRGKPKMKLPTAA